MKSGKRWRGKTGLCSGRWSWRHWQSLFSLAYTAKDILPLNLFINNIDGRGRLMSSKKWLLMFACSVLIIVFAIAGFNFITDPFGVFGDRFQLVFYNFTQNPRVAKIVIWTGIMKI